MKTSNQSFKMKIVLLFILFISGFQFVSGQIITIPDETLKDYILDGNGPWIPGWDGADANNDGEVQLSEALTVVALDMDLWATFPNPIVNLEGLQYFTNLQFLKLRGHAVSDLTPISQLTSLKVLNVQEQQYSNMEALDVTQLINLEELICSNNVIEHLDLSQNPNLQILFAANNQLKTINIKNGVNTENGNFTFFNNPDFEFICIDPGDYYPEPGSSGYPDFEVASYCPFIPNGESYEVIGSAAFDELDDGCDTSDPMFPNMSLEISNGTETRQTTTDLLGNYNILFPSGQFTISPMFESSSYFTVSPPSITVNFPTDPSPLAQDFCLTANGVHPDLEISIASLQPARPGFDASYRIIYTNKGNEVTSGAIELTFNDSVMDHVSSIPMFETQSTNQLGWSFADLALFETRYIDVVFNINGPTETPPVVIDDVLSFGASITIFVGDETPEDNLVELNQVVVGSFDPNDITCLEGSSVTDNFIGEYVHYLIRFENTGSFMAENVAIKDVVNSSQLDISSVQLIDASHQLVMRGNGDVLEFLFEGINLPFEAPENQGYVVFKIKTNSELQQGDVFSNSAEIYFDFNNPIITNTFITQIEEVLAIRSVDLEEELKIYPNPTSSFLEISTKNSLQIEEVEVFNLLGKRLFSSFNRFVDLSSLASGMYLVKIQTNLGKVVKRVVKQ